MAWVQPYEDARLIDRTIWRLHGRQGGWSETLTLPGPLRHRPVPLTPTVTIAAVLSGVVGAVTVWAGGDSWASVVLALALMLVLGAVALAVLVPAGLRPFGVLHLVYLVLVVAVPLVGLAVGVETLAGGRSAGWWLVVVILGAPAGIGWWATHVEPFRLVVETVVVPIDAARRGRDVVRIGVLADLQTNTIGPHEHAAVDRLLAEAPDLILVPGDLFQVSPERFARDADKLRALLGRLSAPHGVYFVRGDAERWDYAERAVYGTGIVMLDDEMVTLTVGDRRIHLGGNRLEYLDPAAVALRQALQGGPDDGAIRILVAHRPDAVLDLAPGSRVDLTVAGHTHGGQVVVPGFGPPLTLTSVPRQAARGGLHAVNGNLLYVSAGVGLERAQAPQLRLFCPPTIGVLVLQS
jgi:predicted MPP superfamily phosphohydrolase